MGEVKSVNPVESPAPPKPIKTNNKSIVVLRIQSRLSDVVIEELEEKYSKKFGCKVVILESNLEMADVING